MAIIHGRGSLLVCGCGFPLLELCVSATNARSGTPEYGGLGGFGHRGCPWWCFGLWYRALIVRWCRGDSEKKARMVDRRVMAFVFGLQG